MQITSASANTLRKLPHQRKRIFLVARVVMHLAAAGLRMHETLLYAPAAPVPAQQLCRFQEIGCRCNRRRIVRSSTLFIIRHPSSEQRRISVVRSRDG